MVLTLWLVLVLVGALALAHVNANGWAWIIGVALALFAAASLHVIAATVVLFLAAIFAFFAVPMLIPPLRRALVSEPLFTVFRKVMPPMSQTERDAIEAGTVWWDGDLFSGRPDWRKLLAMPAPALTSDEQRFLDEDVEELCAMVTDWETTNIYKDLPAHVWQFIRERGFLGMIIPKQYGGKGFSAFAHSEVITKLSTRSGTVAVTVMVPNSLGPAELLLHYGTEEQKKHYLPRLARGEDVPCFGLSGPEAGSDAAATQSTGVG